MRKSFKSVVGVVAAIALLGAACGDDDDSSEDSSSETTAADGSTDTTDGGGDEATGEPIVVSSISHDTGAGNLAAVADGFAAFVAYINENGGVDGRPLEQERCDIGGDAQRAADCAREAAENPDIVVAAGAENRFAFDAASILASASDPMAWVCPGPVVPQENSAPTAFCMSAGSSIAYYLSMSHFADQGFEQGTFVTTDTETGHASGDLFERQAESLGLSLQSTFFSPQTADFLPIAQGVVAQDPDFILYGAGVDQNLQLSRAFATVGNTIPMATLGALLPEASREQLCDVPYEVTHDAPLPSIQNSDDPEIELYLEWMESEGKSESIGTLSLQGWLSGRLVQKVIEAIGAENATRATILDYLNTQSVEVPLIGELSLANAPTETPGQSRVANATAYVAKFPVEDCETEITDESVTLP